MYFCRDDAVVDINGAEVFPRNHLFTEADIAVLKEREIDQIKVRSVLTCREKFGFCAHCFGRDLARGKLISIGEAVGVIAAQSIGEPGTQLTMRTFHVGGTATAGAQVNKIEVATAGTIHLENVQTALTADGANIIMSKTGEIVIKNNQGVEKERHPAVYGAKLFVKTGDQIQVGDKITEWDPFAIPILSEVAGTIKYKNLIVGLTVNEQVDAVTGLPHRTIAESKDASMQPAVMVCGADGKPLIVPGTKREAVYALPVGANVIVYEDDAIGVGEPIAKMQRETTKTKDITGGLPRVAELFEARKPANSAQIADVAGIVEFGPELRGNRRIIIRPEDGSDPVTYTVPKGRYVIVNEGDYIRAGEPIMDGPSNPHDILRVMGIKELARYIVDEIQEVYRMQGVKIDDKHIEVIVSQMLKKVEITNPGDSTLVSGDSITKSMLVDINEEIVSKGGEPAQSRPLLLGITKASLTTDSFISAASFQETTKVLTQATLEGKKDKLRGLKENVIMGRLIPAGSGVSNYRDFDAVIVDDEKEGSDESQSFSF